MPVLSNCPDCSASLAVLRIIPGRAGAEYWTMRCTRCGGIHLDIVNPSAIARDGMREMDAALSCGTDLYL